jgi:hypothetical protein
METWVQFSLLMLALLAIALRNEHRITIVEGEIRTERELRKADQRRIDKLEAQAT